MVEPTSDAVLPPELVSLVSACACVERAVSMLDCQGEIQRFLCTLMSVEPTVLGLNSIIPSEMQNKLKYAVLSMSERAPEY